MVAKPEQIYDPVNCATLKTDPQSTYKQQHFLLNATRVRKVPETPFLYQKNYLRGKAWDNND